jgi:hypothetical protein
LLLTASTAFAQTSMRKPPKAIQNRPYQDKNIYTSPRVYNGNRELAYRYTAPPKSREYRRVYVPYRKPVEYHMFWTPEIRMEFLRWYPAIGYYKYPVGYAIENVSAYDALLYRGEIVNIYGKVFECYYSRYSDEYILYFGAYYPYHDFMTIIPGDIARHFSPWPERYFSGDHLIVTGLVTAFEGIPEIAVRSYSQLRLY